MKCLPGDLLLCVFTVSLPVVAEDKERLGHG